MSRQLNIKVHLATLSRCYRGAMCHNEGALEGGEIVAEDVMYIPTTPSNVVVINSLEESSPSPSRIVLPQNKRLSFLRANLSVAAIL
jgi:predicted RNA-binding protein